MSGLARMAKRQSEQLIGSILKLEDLAECIMLSDVNGFIVELDDPTGQVNFGVLDVPITISYLNGTPFLRGRYTHLNHNVNVYGAGDDEENSIFSLTLSAPPRLKHPAAILAGPIAVEKKLSAPHLQEVAKLKHKTGLTVYRINKTTSVRPLAREEASDLSVVRPNQTVALLDMRVEKTCCSTFLHWLGLTFHNTQFICYRRDQRIGVIHPKISCGWTQYAYTVKFEDELPAPAHVSKTIVLASTIAMLLKLGPINIRDQIIEER